MSKDKTCPTCKGSGKILVDHKDVTTSKPLIICPDCGGTGKK